MKIHKIRSVVDSQLHDEIELESDDKITIRDSRTDKLIDLITKDEEI